MGRKKAREGSMKLLYQMDLRNDFSKDIYNRFLESNNYSLDEEKYINETYNFAVEKKEEIDRLIENNSHGWNINRLSKVDLSILRIAVYEILYREDIPIEVSINEAIENSKKYSNEGSYKFINGVLGGVVRTIKQKE